METIANVTRTRTRKTSRGVEFCAVTLALREGQEGKGPEFSVTAVTGLVVSERAARAQARRYWEGFFAENKAEILDLNDRCGTRFTSSVSAARYVLRVDGELHGLDVFREEDGKVWISETSGCDHEAVAQWFPELEPYLQYHLNNMKPTCEHQEARGETYNTYPSAVCPDCGYKLGSAWLSRPLPRAVYELIAAWAVNEPATVRAVYGAAEQAGTIQPEVR